VRKPFIPIGKLFTKWDFLSSSNKDSIYQRQDIFQASDSLYWWKLRLLQKTAIFFGPNVLMFLFLQGICKIWFVYDVMMTSQKWNVNEQYFTQTYTTKVTHKGTGTAKNTQNIEIPLLILLLWRHAITNIARMWCIANPFYNDKNESINEKISKGDT